MGRLVVVSNRVAPITEGEPTAGGLAAGVMDALREKGGIWFGWSGETAAVPGPPRERRVGAITVHTIDLTGKDLDDYYNGFANSTLWPILHYQPNHAAYDAGEFAAYLRVNAQFADALAELIEPDDLVWCHDYHLFGLADALRARGLENRIGLFLHTPLPSPQVLMTIPAHRELMRAVCGYDLVGFQTRIDRQAFLDYLVQYGGGRAGARGEVSAFNRVVQTGVYPIGVDVGEIQAQAATPVDGRQAARLAASLGDGKLAIGVDRLDYSKGLRERFISFERLLERYPHRRSHTTLLQIAPPSRTDIQTYRLLRSELEGEAGRINGRFAELDWVPMRYLNKGFPRSVLMPLYRMAQVGLVTPLRDGMNLVAKEYVAAQDAADPGVLVLSQFAGAAEELQDALLVNPFDQAAVAAALDRALDMPRDERRARHAGMIRVLRRNNLRRWRDRFTTDLSGERSHQQADDRAAAAGRERARQHRAQPQRHDFLAPLGHHGA
ncbi:MAG TPA: trehalose-6-phosphate synthase [Acetobacteraceae bacterium]|nr:trehalose-6-phosphate synthase [Acetobacteraceae bacterium]